MEPCETLEESLRTEDEWARAGVVFLKNMLKETGKCSKDAEVRLRRKGCNDG